MKFFRASITLKFFLFLCVSITPIVAMIFFLAKGKENIFYLAVTALAFLLIFIAFIFIVTRPLHRITSEVRSLMSGKKYKRIPPHSPDNIGIFTHFFNEVTKNLEKLSGDITTQKRIFSELDIARKIQQDVLPKKAENIKGLEIVAKSKAAAEMGGDSFDFIKRDENTMIYIGDVTGHGLPAGLVMMMVNTLIHAFSINQKQPSEILSLVNKVLYERISSQKFITLVMLRWDSLQKKMFFTGAGHEHILVYRSKTKNVEKVKSGGIALRMVPDIRSMIEEKQISLDENDVILLYTDGITEARNERGEMYGIESLVESLRRHGFRNTSDSIFTSISEDFSNFVGSNFIQDDDITMITVKYLPVKEAERETKPVKLTFNSHSSDNVAKKQKWSWNDS